MFVRRQQAIAEINVVPYIDVMLVLLVIFMITTPLLTQGVDVDLPKAESTAISEQQREPIVVSINQDGKLFLNISNDPTKAIETQQLLTRVAAELILDEQQHTKRMVLVKGDQNVNYGNVVRVMAMLQQAGVDKVGLLTDGSDTDGVA